VFFIEGTMHQRALPTIGIALFLGLAAATAQPEAPPARFGIYLNQRLYPQSTAREALGSVLAAIDRGRADYVLAQLTDPGFVDDRVRRVHAGDFDGLVAEASLKLADNPGTIAVLARFLKEGDWQENEATATARLKDVPDRQVYLTKLGTRWYLENRQR
jgi:hypothetical protein